MRSFYIRRNWRFLLLPLTPLVLLPLLLVSSTQECRCAYVVVLMAVWWTTEALPLAVTALVPVALFPLLGILSTHQVSIVYLKDTNMLFLGGLMVAVAIEETNLHVRVALKVLLLVGTSPRRIMLGILLTTSFLSMWINNTATTAMMVPIVEAVLNQLQNTEGTHVGGEDNSGYIDQIDDNNAPVSTVLKSQTNVNVDQSNEKNSSDHCHQMSNVSLGRLKVGLYLSVAYASNIGGTGALNGTGPNLVLKGVLQQRYGSETGLNFATWLLFCLPTMIICVILAWFWLQRVFVGRLICKVTGNDDGGMNLIRQVIQKKYDSLGQITFPEMVVMFLFSVLVLLWVFRDPKFIEGWDVYFPRKEVRDATVVMAVVVLLFGIPVRFASPPPGGEVHRQERSLEPILTWRVMHEKLEWSVILLIGGGFATAEASKVSGLSEWLGHQLTVFGSLPPIAIVVIVSLMTALLTEVTSNTATASIFLPVLADMSEAINLHPLYTMLPATLACSYAFMLPIATPPNAIVFTAAKMNNYDMIVSGFVMNVACVAVTSFMIGTLGLYLFDLNSFPSWAQHGRFVLTEHAQNGSLSIAIATGG